MANVLVLINAEENVIVVKSGRIVVLRVGLHVRIRIRYVQNNVREAVSVLKIGRSYSMEDVFVLMNVQLLLVMVFFAHLHLNVVKETQLFGSGPILRTVAINLDVSMRTLQYVLRHSLKMDLNVLLTRQFANTIQFAVVAILPKAIVPTQALLHAVKVHGIWVSVELLHVAHAKKAVKKNVGRLLNVIH